MEIKNTRTAGKVVLLLKQVDSTNSHLRALVQTQEVEEGTVVYSLNQFAGRGQMGTDWISEKGKGLNFSILWKPVFLPTEDQFRLSQAMALACTDLLTDQGISRVAIKWPNDLYAGQRKLGGILIQNLLSGGRLSHSICGIGINVRQETFPLSLPNPTSLYLETGRRPDPEELLAPLCGCLENRYFRLRKGDYASLEREYLERLYRFGEAAPFRTAKGDFRGVISGVEPNGKLLVRDLSGKLSGSYGLKEIEMLF